eukprot:638420-Prorocentrum_lima.AAC.1
MTSSLVGSEMCIRDSTRTSASSYPSAHDDSPDRIPSPTRLRSQSLLAPVSYTHLTLPTICSV